MANQARDIRPEDVFPKRNLPDPAEPWGRAVEGRTQGAENGVIQLRQSLDNSNRQNAASLATLADNITRLNEQIQDYSQDFSSPDTSGGLLYPDTNYEMLITAPSWAKRGTVIGAKSVRSGTYTALASPDTYNFAMFGDTYWNGNSPTATMSSYPYWSGGFPWHQDSQDHSHPVETVDTVTGQIRMVVHFSASATFSGITVTPTLTILWS